MGQPKFSEVQRHLLALLHAQVNDETLDTIDGKLWPDILQLARKQSILAYLFYHLQQKGLSKKLPDATLHALQNAFKKQTMRNLRLNGELKRIARVLSTRNIPIIALKGLHLVGGIYPHVGTRFLRDIDVVVPIAQAKVAFDCIRTLGYESDIPDPSLFRFENNHHLPQFYHKERNVFLELHGHISPPLRFRLDTEAFWHRAVPAQNDPQSHLVLCPEDLFLHLCVHISYTDGFHIDLRHYLDLALLLQTYADRMQWDEVVARAEQHGAGNGVYLVLCVVSSLFGTTIPAPLERFRLDEKETARFLEIAFEFLWAYDKGSDTYFYYKWFPYSSENDESEMLHHIKKMIVPKDTLISRQQMNGHTSFYYAHCIRLKNIITNLLTKKLFKRERLKKKIKFLHTTLRS